MRPVLEAVGVSFRVDEADLLDGVDIQIHAGEMLGIVGPNGAGKSTLLRLLAGEAHPTGGEVSLQGRPIGD